MVVIDYSKKVEKVTQKLAWTLIDLMLKSRALSESLNIHSPNR